MISSNFVVRLATTDVLPAVTFDGAVATAVANGALSVDGVAVGAGDLILVKNQVAPAENGVFAVVDAGDGANPFVLERESSALGLKLGNVIFVKEGTINTSRLFCVTEKIDMVGYDNTIVDYSMSSLVVSDITEEVAGDGVNFNLDVSTLGADTGGILVNGVRILRDRLPAIAGFPVPYAAGANPTQAEFDALVDFVNALYAGLSENAGSGHGLFNQLP